MKARFDVSTGEVDDVVFMFDEWLKSRGDSLKDFQDMMFFCFCSELVYFHKFKSLDFTEMFKASYDSYRARLLQVKEV